MRISRKFDGIRDRTKGPEYFEISYYDLLRIEKFKKFRALAGTTLYIALTMIALFLLATGILNLVSLIEKYIS